MNTHVPPEIIEKYPTYEFRGQPFQLQNGKLYIRAYHHTLNRILFYCFEEDFFWFDREDILNGPGIRRA